MSILCVLEINRSLTARSSRMFLGLLISSCDQVGTYLVTGGHIPGPDVYTAER